MNRDERLSLDEVLVFDAAARSGLRQRRRRRSSGRLGEGDVPRVVAVAGDCRTERPARITGFRPRTGRPPSGRSLDGGRPTRRNGEAPLDRLLSLFADVHRGEGGRLLLLTFNVFLILTAYYVMKPVREALILAQPGGAEIKSYSMALQAVLLVAIVPAYGALAGKLSRRRLINAVTAFFLACLPVFYLAAEARWQVGVAVLPVDRDLQPDGHRAVLGLCERSLLTRRWQAVVCRDRVRRLVRRGVRRVDLGSLIGELGVHAMLLVAAVILAASLMLFNLIDARERNQPVIGRGATTNRRRSATATRSRSSCATATCCWWLRSCCC